MENYMLLPNQRGRAGPRHPADQKLIDNWAEDYFLKAELEYLASVLGKPINQLTFDLEEYQNFFPIHGTTSLQHREQRDDFYRGATDATAAFYRAALTLDRVLFHMRALDSIIGASNAGNVTNSLDTLAVNLPQPDWIPAPLKDVVLPNNLRNIKQWSILGNLARDDTKIAYLVQFPVTHGLLAVAQGNYLRDPLDRDSDFNAGNLSCRDYHVGQYTAPGAALPAAAGGDVVNLPTIVGFPPLNAEGAAITGDGTVGFGLVNVAHGGVFQDAFDENELAKSLRRSGGLLALFALFNKLMKNYEALLVTATGNIKLTTTSFIGNLNKGSNYGNAMRCPAGTEPVYYDRDGNAIEDMRSVMYTVNGKTRLNLGKIDIGRTQCERAVSVMAARRRRRKLSAMRVPFRSVAFPRALAARKHTGRKHAPRDSKGRFIKTTSTSHRRPVRRYRAMAVPRAMRAVPVPASFGARRRHRRTTTRPSMAARKNARADWENLFDYAGISGEINPLGPDGDVDTAALKAIYNNDLDVPAPAPAAAAGAAAPKSASATATQAARRRRKRLMRATMLTPAMRAAARLAALKVNIAQARKRHSAHKTKRPATRPRPTMRRRALY